MADIDKIVGFEERWQRMLAKFKRGDEIVHPKQSPESDGSVERAVAFLLYRKFGALRDDSLELLWLKLDWRGSYRPVLRLAPDLFEAVAHA